MKDELDKLVAVADAARVLRVAHLDALQNPEELRQAMRDLFAALDDLDGDPDEQGRSSLL